MPPLQPWLTRLLVAWAASLAASGAVLQSAQNRYQAKPKKKLTQVDEDDAEQEEVQTQEEEQLVEGDWGVADKEESEILRKGG